MRIGFVGLGTMGAPMAERLLAAGHVLHVHNRTRAREAPLVALGALPAASPAAAAADAELVFTMVSDTPDVEAVVFGPSGSAETIPAGALLVDMSTISPSATTIPAAGFRFTASPPSAKRFPPPYAPLAKRGSESENHRSRGAAGASSNT